MADLFSRFRSVIIPFVLTAIALTILIMTEDQWHSWRSVTRILPFWLLSVSCLVALQFNRSRLAYLSLLLLLFYTVKRSILFDSQLLQLYHYQIFSFGCLSVVALSIIKDRALISIHGAVTLMILLILAGFSMGINHYIESPTLVGQENLLTYFWLVTALSIMIISLYKVTLSTTTLAISFSLWSIIYFYPQFLPVDLSLICIAVLLLISVLFDSYMLAYRDELTNLPSRRALYNLVLSSVTSIPSP